MQRPQGSNRERNTNSMLSKDVYIEGCSSLANRQNSRSDPHLAAIWDHLSTIHLTRRALQEFNRRSAKQGNTHSALTPRSKQLKGHSSSAKKILLKSKLQDQYLKRFARQGGPDLSDIVGVS